MSNKLKKKITCCLCDKTAPLTDDCKTLFGKDVCPDCGVRLVKLVERILEEKEEIDNRVEKNTELHS